MARISLEHGIASFSNSTVGTFTLTTAFDKPPIITISPIITGSTQDAPNFFIHSVGASTIVVSSSNVWSGQVNVFAVSKTFGA